MKRTASDSNDGWIYEEVETPGVYPDWDGDKVWAAIERRRRPRSIMPLWWTAAAVLTGIGLFSLFWQLDRPAFHQQPAPKLVARSLSRTAEAASPALPSEPIAEAPQSINSAPKVHLPNYQPEAPADTSTASGEPTKATNERERLAIRSVPRKLAAETPLLQVPVRPLPDRMLPGSKVVLVVPVLPETRAPEAAYLVRMFRQFKRFNTEGDIDWLSLNIIPGEAWSFLIFSYEKPDSAQHKTTPPLLD